MSERLDPSVPPTRDVVQAQEERQEGNCKEGRGSGVSLSRQSGPDPQSTEHCCDNEPTPAPDHGRIVEGRRLEGTAAGRWAAS